jgi:hypothetical protein
VTPTRRHGSREITAPVDLCRPDGTLADAAVGWTRRPLHRANLRRRGRAKRWEYWCVQTPELVLALTVSDLDYAALCSVWVLDGRDASAPRETGTTRMLPLPRLTMPDRCGSGPVEMVSRGLRIALTPHEQGVHLSARTPDVSAEVDVTRPDGHESLGVVVPWSRRRFQYTVKENTLPVAGWVQVGGERMPVGGPDAWATLDHGRGQWPYRITWNWGSGSGRVRTDADVERVLGIQVGGRWTDGTGSTENALTLDGVVHPVLEELDWHYDRSHWTAPWRVVAPSGALDLELRPSYERRDRTSLGVLANETHQCFGTWHGRVRVEGVELAVDGIHGWGEEVRNRW